MKNRWTYVRIWTSFMPPQQQQQQHPPLLNPSILFNSKAFKLFIFLFVYLAVSKCYPFFLPLNFWFLFHFFVGAGQAEPGFRCSILLYKVVRYAFPAIWLVFGIYPKQIGWGWAFCKICAKFLVNQKRCHGNSKR